MAKDKLHYDTSGSTFKEAFKEARSEGKKTFEWNGTKYTTEMAASKPDESKAETARLKNAGDKARRASVEESDKPLEASHPEDFIGGLGIKALARGAKSLVQAGERKAAEKATESLAAANRREALKEKAKSGTRAGKQSAEDAADINRMGSDFRKGGRVKKMAGGGSASSRGDGIAMRGKTKGRMC
jgi:hypothetical protein